jgi:hypothetical protein
MSYVVLLLAMLLVVGLPLLGVIAFGWEGAKNSRLDFWYVFVPCLAWLILDAFFLGKLLGQAH